MQKTLTHLVKKTAVFSFIFSLTACNNGGNESDPQNFVQIYPNANKLSFAQSYGDERPFVLDGTWQGTNLPSDTIYFQAVDSSEIFTKSSLKITKSSSGFKFNISTNPGLASGTHTGFFKLRACKDIDCVDPYQNSEINIPYTLIVAAVTDWETHQRDAAHQGYLPIWLNSEKFLKAWEWQRDLDVEPIGGINSIVTGNGKVYVTNDLYFGQGILYALNESDGKESWRATFGHILALDPPAAKDGLIYVKVGGQTDKSLWSFDASNGMPRYKWTLEGQSANYLSPTIYRNQIYVGGGYSGGDIYALNSLDGTQSWRSRPESHGAWDLYTPAVDENRVYHHNGTTLFIIDRNSGKELRQIVDQSGSFSTSSYHAAPMLGNNSNVIAFSGSAFSGMAGANTEQYEQRKLSSFNAANSTYLWSTKDTYLTAPAIANGIIYAARNDPMSLDAIDETSGKVLWSWAPTNPIDTSFHRNIVVTDNLLFVSTNNTVYALDLTKRATVWKYPEPGMLAISADRMLYIATGARASNGRLVAITLK